MPAQPLNRSGRRPGLFILGLILLAAILTIIGGFMLRSAVLELPLVRVLKLSSTAYQQAERSAAARMDAAAREAFIAANISHLFTATLREPAAYEANRDTLTEMTQRLRRTQLGRLQRLAFLLLERGRAGIPPADLYPIVEEMTRGLERASFDHQLNALQAHRIYIFRALGFSPGQAHQQASMIAAHPHGPLLQYLTARLLAIASARDALDDGSADYCRRLAARLLRQWILSDGPAGLRLLAADLLARVLETSPPGEFPAAADLAQDLHDWRTIYRNSANGKPSAAPLIDPTNSPELYPDRARALAEALTGAIWLAAGIATAAAITLIALAFSLRPLFAGPHRNQSRARKEAVANQTRARANQSRDCKGAVGEALDSPHPARPPIPRIWPAVVMGLILTLFLVFIGANVALQRNAAVEDLRRWSGQTPWPHGPFDAAAITLTLFAFIAIPRPPRTTAAIGRGPRVALAGAVCWLILSTLLIASVARTNSAADAYYVEPWSNSTPIDEIAAIAGPHADEELTRLRAWQP